MGSMTFVLGFSLVNDLRLRNIGVKSMEFTSSIQLNQCCFLQGGMHFHCIGSMTFALGSFEINDL